ncbi:MAG: PAS domain-containing protein [Anaerolineae bacterium]|uniref:two-component system sensor histidine kinase NtrB n=1 Tax=Promineifilum sp. TaxID=2664178 RepID=UPI001D8AFB6C|nr:PAS domain-containing protein [Anaerolineales bacterium]MCO5179875.1 ATP-binding protein [Promineifilum sp.]MCW5847035.1 PAS domain-containing protein [Anaerolineae bacterium]
MEIVQTEPFPDLLRHLGLEGILVLAENGKILSANRAAESLLGYGAGQLTNLSIIDLYEGYHPSGRATADWARSRAADLVRRDGEPLPVSVVVAPMEGSAAGEQLMSFVSRAELNRLNESLLHAQRLAGIGTLTASVAHELTNPISIITASCANLMDELNEGTLGRDEMMQAIELIEQSAFRCARIVDMLRNYAPHVGPDGDVEEADNVIAVTSPAAILQDALTMVEQQFRKQARVTMEADLQPQLTTIFCDHHRIAQVLINLLLNARDAMQPEGGVIRVRFWTPDLAAEPVLAAQVRSALIAADNRRHVATADLFAFSVADTGTGLDPAIMDRLFEPFFTTKANHQGTGLGLFIARSIVTQYGGCLYAENNPTGGATFTVVLPRKQ